MIIEITIEIEDDIESESFYCYGTRDPFYEQFLANADAVEAAGVRVERLQLDGRPHGFGYRENWFDAYDSFLTNVFTGM